MLRGVRGATTAENTAESISEATVSMLTELVKVNRLSTDDLAAAIFALTPDLNAAFAATAARSLGWERVPLLDHVSPAVPGSLPQCIRVLLLWNTSKPQAEICHVYQRGARVLRPDLMEVND